MEPAFYARKKEECIRKLRTRFLLSGDPAITFSMRPLFDTDDPEHLYAFENKGLIKVTPPGYYMFHRGNQQLMKAEFFQLFEQMAPDTQNRTWLIKMQVRYEGIVRDAAYKWGYIGTLKSGERFAVIFLALVRRAFRKCGLANLLKMKEVELLRDLKCGFIQTYLETCSPHFVPSIIPNLRDGFAFSTGIVHREELYRHQCDYVHLRKHFFIDPPQVRVVFATGLQLISPKQNPEIIQYLLKKRRFSSYNAIRVLPFSSSGT